MGFSYSFVYPAADRSQGDPGEQFRLRVREIDRTVQCRGKRHPCNVGDKEVRGTLPHPVKGADGCHDHHPEKEDVNKTKEGRLKAEEEERPDNIEEKLHAEYPEGDLYIAVLCAGLPDKIERDTHEHEERDPHGCKDPVWRGKERFLQGGIPGARPGDSHKGADAADKDTKKDCCCQLRVRLYHYLV
jgi:hypothetical protein